MQQDRTFQQRMQRIETLLQKVESYSDPVARDSTRELIQLVMDLHGAGLERMMENIWQKGQLGSVILEEMAADDLIGSMLLLYNLHPVDLRTRVLKGLEKVRPYLRSHGGNVDLIEVSEGGVVRLRLEGSCHGCPSSAMTMKLAIEDALFQAAPDIGELIVEGVVEAKKSQAFVNAPVWKKDVEQETSTWKEVAGLEMLGQGSVRTMDVSGREVLFCRLGETLYAYQSHCPGCKKTLQEATIESTALVCAACGLQYDAMSAGRALNEESTLHLEPLPLLIEQGRTRIALPSQ